MIDSNDEFTCSRDDLEHDGEPRDIRMVLPDYCLGLTEEELSNGRVTNDLYVIGEHRFIRGLIELPIIGRDDAFAYSAWVSVSQKSFARCLELWDESAGDDEPPYFGWLNNDLPGYPETYGLKTNLRLRSVKQLPSIELQTSDHPLAVDQREGITMARVNALLEAVLHPIKT